jgi:hypothetical protein
MRAKLLVLAGGCALAFAAPAAAAPGQCFDAAAQPIGPIYDTEAPDTRFITWVQARGGECRALRADEVTLYRGQPREYPSEYRRVEIETSPPQAAPGAPPAPPPPLAPGAVATWQGDPVVARRLIVMHYQPRQPNLTVTDTGRVLQFANGTWRVYETVYPDGSRRQVAVQMRADRQYVLVEQSEGGSWSRQVIELEE